MPAQVASSVLYATMAAWACLGLAAILHDARRLQVDRAHLDVVADKPKEAVGEWADAHLAEQAPLARWIQTLRNIERAEEQPDTAALSNAIWGQERSRHFLYRFFARNAILVGLLFTIYGLSVAIGTITPALASELTTLEAWKSEVIVALKGAMRGMEGAFTASLLGVGTSLGLNLVALVLVTWRHERYLGQLDAVMQGQLIPMFSPAARRRDALQQVLAKFEVSVQAFSALYRDSLDRAEAQRTVLGQVGGAITAATLELNHAITVFAGENERLAASAHQIERGHVQVATSLEGGLGSLEEAVGAFRSQVAEPFTAKVDAERQAQQALIARFETAAAVLDGAGQAIAQLTATAEALASRVDSQGQAAVDGLTGSIDRTVAESLARQEAMVRDLHEGLARRWDELLKAYELIQGTQAP